MSGTLNKLQLIGHIGNEPAMTTFNDGGKNLRCSLATNESYTNKSTGEKVNSTEWHNLSFKNKAAEVVEKYAKIGDKIYVEGRLKTRSWDAENGEKKYITECIVTEFLFLTPQKTS